eukprot:4572648-Amphidinium_carterae.2
MAFPPDLRELWFDPASPEEEGRRLLDPAAWGGELAIWATAQFLCLEVRVHLPGMVLVYGPHGKPSTMVVHVAYNGSDHYDAVQGMDSGPYKRQRVNHVPSGPKNDKDVRAAVAKHGFALDNCAWAVDWPEAVDARFAWPVGRTRFELEAELARLAQEHPGTHSFDLAHKALKERRLSAQVLALIAGIAYHRMIVFDGTAPMEYGVEFSHTLVLVRLSDGIHVASAVQSSIRLAADNGAGKGKPHSSHPRSAAPLDILQQAAYKRDADMIAPTGEVFTSSTRVHFEALNVISLQACTPDILATAADVYVCSECNLQAKEVPEFKALAAAKGYRAMVPTSPKAGVVVLTRSTLLRCWELQIPELQPWIDQGRVMPVRITTHTGTLVAVVLAVYANQAGAVATASKADLRDDFTQLFCAIERYVVEAGPSPIIVAGDMNVPIDGQRSLRNLTMAGILVDVIAQSLDGPRRPTCTGSNAIDHFLVTRAVLFQNAVATQSAHRWPQDHAVLDLFLDLAVEVSCLTQFKAPEALPKECMTQLPCELCESWTGPLNTQAFETALAAGQVDRAYELWSASWETLLMDRVATNGGNLDKKAIGRGAGPGYAKYIPRSNASRSDGMAEPLRSSWRIMLSRLKQVQAQLRSGKPLDMHGRRIIHDAAFHAEDGWHLDLDAEPELACETLVGIANQKVMAERRAKRAARIQAWQVTLSQFNDPFSTRSHKYIRGDWVQPLTCVTLDDGSVVTELDQMDVAVTQAWQEVAKPKGTTLQASQQHLRDLADCIPVCEPEPMRPITARDLMQALNKAKLRRSPGERPRTSKIRKLRINS